MEGRGGWERGVSAEVSKGRAWSSDQEGAQRTGRSGESRDGQGGTWDLGVTLVIPTSVRVPDSCPQAAVRV